LSGGDGGQFLPVGDDTLFGDAGDDRLLGGPSPIASMAAPTTTR
jgi:hypothetical protein